MKAWVNGYRGVFDIQDIAWDSIAKEVKYKIRGYWHSAENLQPYKEEIMEEKKINQMSLANCDLDEVEIILGDKFELKIKEGKYYAVKKQPQYPKTYKECCDVLGLKTMDNDAQGYKAYLIISFQELLIARDAYWKIAGEQMGLDKPWEPDWSDESENKYTIVLHGNKHCYANCKGACSFLTFPTAEMLDAFYENFKVLIVECKVFL